MNVQQMVELVGQKDRSELHPKDPIVLVRSMFDASIADAHTQLAKIVTDAADQIATSNVLAENSARAKAETIVTGSGKWSSEQMRTAGENAAKRLAEPLSEAVVRIEAAALSMRASMWVSSISAAVSVVAAMVAVVVVLRAIGG